MTDSRVALFAPSDLEMLRRLEHQQRTFVARYFGNSPKVLERADLIGALAARMEEWLRGAGTLPLAIEVPEIWL